MAVTLRVYQNGDDVFLTWRIKQRIPGCRGFAVLRRLNGEPEAPLRSFAGFENEDWKRGDSKPSTVWPIQKFWWTDYTTRTGDTVRYRVVPVVRDGEALVPLLREASRWSTPRTISHQVSPHFACFFNRGVVASQFVQRLLGEKLTVEQRQAKLDEVIVDLENPGGRNVLAGDLRLGLRQLLRKAADERLTVRGALFELTDEELIRDLERIGPRLDIVLADGAPSGSAGSGGNGQAADNEVPTGQGTAEDENAAARVRLRAAGATVHNRFTSKKFLSHNKVVVVCDESGAPRWTWTGSTNWTPTGLCTQTNNGLLIDDAKVAEQFADKIRALADAGHESPDVLAKANSTSVQAKVDGATVTTWFARTVGKVDLADAIRRIEAAQEGALFLMFQTGLHGSLLEAILKRRAEPNFFVHGVISSKPRERAQPGQPSSGEQSDGAAGQIAFVHKNQRAKYAPDLLLPFALTKPSERWLKEFVKKNGAHAIVHSKVVVLDPFGRNPVVITGSHNLGTTASTKHDENLVIVEGNRPLAAAYVANIMAIYDNYRWRFRVAEGSKWKGSQDKDTWQDRYLAGEVPEFRFFGDA